MKIWQIQYWQDSSKHSVEKWILNLPHEQLKSITKEIELLKINGNKLKLPHSKSLSKGIFELRERRYGLRIYYCFKENQIIILLCAGDKASQANDIIVARKIFNKIKS